MFGSRWREPGSSWQILRPRLVHSELWEGYFWGNRSLSCVRAHLHDPGGAGVAGLSRYERGQRCRQWRRFPLVGFALGLLWAGSVTGCRPQSAPDPTVTFKQISSDSLHGNLEVAYEKADEARQSYATSDTNWSMRFRLRWSPSLAHRLNIRASRPDLAPLLSRLR